ncbi:uncharacterized protein [Littorina saxatilis]|uniref:RNA exonuclease 4 n=1 Tax=Littorina saxatilis TaxID=31220 RepID=A0AAN9AYX5_9CAEN
MQRGMFVLVDSDVDEKELEFISTKLKKLHKRREKKMKERKKKDSSVSPSPPDSDTASVSSVTSSTTSIPQCTQIPQGGLKRKRMPAESEKLVSSKKSLTDKPDIIDGCEQGIGNSFDDGQSVVKKGKLQTQTFKKNETSRAVTSLDRYASSSTNGKVVSQSRNSSKNNTITQASSSLSITRNLSSRNASCLTNCKSCAEDSLLSLSDSVSDEDHREMSNYIALDCEMVGVGPKMTSALGRCSIVDHRGVVIFDRFVQPEDPVTDYRTPWSGLRPRHLKQGIPFMAAQEQVSQLLQGKVVVGHAVYNDFKVLGIPHPVHNIRDTASCKLLREMADLPGGACALRKLTQVLLGRTIQTREHCSVTDARACMDLFRLVRSSWEPVLLAKFQRREARYTPGMKVNATEGEPGLNSYLDDEYWPSDMFTESY